MPCPSLTCLLSCAPRLGYNTVAKMGGPSATALPIPPRSDLPPVSELLSSSLLSSVLPSADVSTFCKGRRDPAIS